MTINATQIAALILARLAAADDEFTASRLRQTGRRIIGALTGKTPKDASLFLSVDRGDAHRVRVTLWNSGQSATATRSRPIERVDHGMR